MKLHNWEIHEGDGGPMGLFEYYECADCGASGGHADINWKTKQRCKPHPFIAGPAIALPQDCDEAKKIVDEWFSKNGPETVDKLVRARVAELAPGSIIVPSRFFAEFGLPGASERYFKKVICDIISEMKLTPVFSTYDPSQPYVQSSIPWTEEPAELLPAAPHQIYIGFKKL